MHEQSESINELAAALVKAQSVITGAIKGSVNPFFKSKYADLETCMEVLREPLSENGLCIIQTLGSDPQNSGPGSITVYTTLAHSSGQWIRGSISMLPEKPGPQSKGACITYARRYSLAIVGLVQIDDDAESSTTHEKTKTNGTIEPPTKPTETMLQAAEIMKTLAMKCSTWDEYKKLWGMSDRKTRDAVGAEFHQQQKERLGVGV